MAERRSRLRWLSTLTIVVGLGLLAWGLVAVLRQHPTPAEQAALARGQSLSREVGLTEAGAPPELLPAPGVASLPVAPPTQAGEVQAEPQPSAEPAVGVPPDAPERPRPTRKPPTRQSSDEPPIQGRIPAHSPPTRILAPTIGLDSPVVEVGWKAVEQDGQLVSTWEVADYAAGFHKGSAYPGNPGNTVLSGHHNIKGEVFRHLVDLKVGDPVYLYAEGREYAYRVVDLFIVQEAGASLEQRRKNAQWIAPTPDERLTLVTCWPYWTNTHRVIVIAKPAEPNTPRVPQE